MGIWDPKSAGSLPTLSRYLLNCFRAQKNGAFAAMPQSEQDAIVEFVKFSDNFLATHSVQHSYMIEGALSVRLADGAQVWLTPPQSMPAAKKNVAIPITSEPQV